MSYKWRGEGILLFIAIVVALLLIGDKFFVLVGNKDLIYHLRGQKVLRKDYGVYSRLVEEVEITWNGKDYKYKRIKDTWVPQGKYIGNIVRLAEMDNFLKNFLFHAKFVRLLDKEIKEYELGKKGKIKIRWKDRKDEAVILVGKKTMMAEMYYCKIKNTVGVVPYFYIRWVDILTWEKKGRSRNDRREGKRDSLVSKGAAGSPKQS